MKISSAFWSDVLQSWSEYNFYTNNKVENQILWYNSRIKIGDNMVFWKDVYNRGLIYIHQLFEDQNFKSAKQVSQEYGLTLLRYNSLKSAIPGSYRDFSQPIIRYSICPYHHKIMI